MHHIHYTVRPAIINCHTPISNVSDLQTCKQPSIYNARPCLRQGGTRFTSKHGHCFSAGPGQARHTYGHNWSTKQKPCMKCINGAGKAKPTKIGSNIGHIVGSGRHGASTNRIHIWRRCNCFKWEWQNRCPGIACYLDEKHPNNVSIVIYLDFTRQAPALRFYSDGKHPVHKIWK